MLLIVSALLLQAALSTTCYVAQRASLHDTAHEEEEGEADQQLHRSVRLESYKMSSGGSMEKDQSAPLLSECAFSENDSNDNIARNGAHPVRIEESLPSQENTEEGEGQGEREDTTVKEAQAGDMPSSEEGWKRMEGPGSAEQMECSSTNHQNENMAAHCVTVKAGDSLAGRVIAVLIHLKMMEIC